MSLFDNLEETGYIFLPETDSLDQTTEYDTGGTWLANNADYTININVNDLGIDELVLFGDIGATHKAHVDGSNASQLVRDCVVVVGSERYKVVQRPKLLKLFNGTYSIVLRRTND